MAARYTRGRSSSGGVRLKPPLRGPARAALGVLALALGAACSPSMSWQAMAEQPRSEPYEYSRFFPDGSSARPLAEGVVPRGSVSDDALLNTGRQDGELADAFPFVVDMAVLARGQARYDIYCAPCHDRAGTGGGIVVRRGYSPPPSLHLPRLREAPAGHFFDVITNGFGAMPSYAPQVAVADRWAIVAYIRALQLSQNAALADVPPEARDGLRAPGAAP